MTASGAGGFPATRFSIVHATGSRDPALRREAWDRLIRAYWQPVYTFIRLRWNATPDDAADLTQSFFAHAFEAGFIERFDPARGRFRTWLRVCLQRFLANEHKAARRLRRGGDASHVSLDFAAAESAIAAVARSSDTLDEETFFHRESVRALLALAVDDLRTELEASGRAVHFRIFARYDLEEPGAGERPTYRELAAMYDLPVTQVTNFLHTTRARFRRIVLDRLREISGTEAEFQEEARALLGVDPP